MILVRCAVLPAILIAALTLAGCGPSSDSKHKGPSTVVSARPHWVTTPNACDVLTDAVAKKLLGDSAHLTRRAQPNPHMSQCQYSSTNGQITIMVGDWKMIHDSNPQDKAVAGLGDEAYDTPGGLDVRKGDIGLNVGVIVESGEFWGSAADDALAQMSAAEKKVAAELLSHL
jgi:hypothetical protein